VQKRSFFVGFLLLIASVGLRAQDERTVTEPVLPAACATLDAQLTSVGHSLAAEDEQKLDTGRIQKAIDHCKSGGVYLYAAQEKNAFLSGPLELKSNVTLVVAKGVTLYASRDPRQFETTPGVCGVVLEKNLHGCRPLIAASHVENAAVMGEGTIDGRGGEKLLGASYTWWNLAEQARSGGAQQAFRLVVADHSDNFTLYQITFKNSPNFHVTFSHGSGFTAWGVKIDTPQRGARNTDGIDPGSDAKNVTIAYSSIRTGDDNVAIKGGAPGGAKQMTIAHNHFYWGHGMSIGSETDGGVDKILVTDLSLDGPDNGIRIKSNGSRGGLTEHVLYDDVCVRNSPNPIVLDTAYSAAGTLKGDHPPSMRAITLHNVRVAGGGKISFNGYDAKHRIAVALDGVQLVDHEAYKYAFNHADVSLGPGPTNLQLPQGEDATLTGAPAPASAAACQNKFVEFAR
jgi:polygalacturonase